MLSLSLSVHAGKKPSAVAAPSAQIGLAGFTRDRVIFDSRFAFGQNSSAVALSGTGTAGEVVQARAYSVDDAGTTSTAWVDIATIGAGGTWAGTITAPRSPSWYRPEVRIKSQPAVTAQGSNRFGVGHVIALWGQSEQANILNSFYSTSSPVNISDPEAVQVISGVAATSCTPTAQMVTNANPITASAAALAATCIATRPGDKFAFLFQCVPGTDPRALVNDADTTRTWAADKALHDFATADGQKVGLCAMDWFASPQGLGSAYAEALFPLFTKKTLAGAAVTIPGTVTYTGGTYQADHWFGELYDYSFTKWIAYGPHKFDILADMQDATHVAAGTADARTQNIQACRTSWRTVPQNAYATMFLVAGGEPLTYSNGKDDGAGSWTDLAHPSAGDDGTVRFARLCAISVLKAAGLSTVTPPAFDNCTWAADGSYVEVWSSAGAITTTRIARGEAALPATYNHWTPVVGFQINGLPAQNVAIVSGRVRITKNGGGNFVASDVLTFGEGGATGMIKFPQDYQNALWKNWLIVNVGAPGLEGLPVQAMPSSAVLANTLPANPNFTTVSGQSTRFKDTVNWPTTLGKMTFAIDGSITSTGASVYLVEMDNVHISLVVGNTGSLLLSLKDSANTTLMSSVNIGGVTLGVRSEVIVAIDLSANTVWTTLNGVTTTRAIAANSGIIESTTSRKFNFLSRATGTNFVIGTFYKLEVWTDAVSGGGRPPSDTNLRTRIVGPAAVANAHAWKLGGNTI